jgi:hypothetical protein
VRVHVGDGGAAGCSLFVFVCGPLVSRSKALSGGLVLSGSRTSSDQATVEASS